MSATTRALAIDPDRPDPDVIDQAADVLRRGGLVAFPTETVYGLGADATNPEAIARIFAAKGRPPTNPLIIHVDGPEMAHRYVYDPGHQLDALADRWWPGPLTLVLRRTTLIPDIVTAGLETVGVRMPASPVALALIRRLDRPIAAPSANRSTGISPTRAEHVLKDLQGRVDLLLDAGPTPLGLESTILDLAHEAPRVLRPGPITARDLADHLGAPVTHETDAPTDELAPRLSPGRMAVHYAPRLPTYWLEPEQLPGFPWMSRDVVLVIGPHPSIDDPPEALATTRLPAPDDAARRLYAALHDAEARAADRIIIVPPPPAPEWSAIRDRLQRAARPWPSRPA